MERKNRTILVFLIAAVIVIAVFSSFGLPFFSPSTAKIVLPSPAPDVSERTENVQPGETQVEITPATVQSVIAALDRLQSYSRTVTTVLNGVEATANVWVDNGWTRTDLTTPSGPTSHTIVGDNTVWRWYTGDKQAVSWSADNASADIEGQRIPTYEDVLALNRSDITAANYEEKNGSACVYVEVQFAELNQTERYWVSADTGLLTAAETVAEGETVYTMTATAPEIPAAASSQFILPNGTVLHTVELTTRAASEPM